MWREVTARLHRFKDLRPQRCTDEPPHPAWVSQKLSLDFTVVFVIHPSTVEVGIPVKEEVGRARDRDLCVGERGERSRISVDEEVDDLVPCDL